MGGLRKITDFWSGLAGPARRLIIGAAAIFVVGLFLLMRLSGQTSYATLVAGASSQDASAITKQLSSAGIPYRLTDGGSAVQVPEGQLAQARLDLASSHLLEGGGGSVGLEIFDTQKLGATDFTQRVNLLRAQQGELERTIQKLDPVETATVNIAMPQERLFTQDASKVTASVVVGLVPGATLNPDQVAGVTRLVAMAVPGLDPKNVTVTDTSGNILEGSDGGSGAGAANTRMAIENAYSQQQQARLTALVAGILGPGQAVINYRAQLNLDSSTMEKETFDPTKVVILDTDKSTEKLRSTGGGSGAAAGASANTPGNTFPTTSSGSGNTNYDKTSTKQTNGVDRTRTSTTTVPGTVASQQISVQISDKVPAAQVTKLQNAIQSAVGYNAQRGDTISVQGVTFGQNALATQQAGAAAQAAKSGGGSPLNIMSIVKGVGAAIGALLVLLMARKSLKRRQSELEKALPELLSRGPVSVASLTEGAGPPRLEGQTKTPVEQQMEDLALRKPDDMAKLVRAWLVQR